MNNQNNFINDLKKQVVPKEQQQQEVTLKLANNIQISAKVFTYNEKEKEDSDLSL